MLLEELLKHTPAVHVDYADLLTALGVIKEVMMAVNNVIGGVLFDKEEDSSLENEDSSMIPMI